MDGHHFPELADAATAMARPASIPPFDSAQDKPGRQALGSYFRPSAGMLGAFLLLPVLSGIALAESHPPEHAAHAAGAVAAPTVSPEIYREFQAIEAFAAQAAYPEAESKARQLLPRLAEEPAAKALLLRNLAALYGLQKHYAHAAQTLEDSLALKALPAGDATRARLELGQYYLAAENYPKAAEALSAWIGQAQAPKPGHYLLLADIQTRLGHYREAAVQVEQAIAHSSEPKPEWYQRLLGLYHESRDVQGCARVLAILIQREPEKALYWQQLTGIYQEAGQEPQALAVRQLMYARGLTESPDAIVTLVQVLRYRGLPNRAAEILQREIDRGRVEGSPPNLGLLADAWTEARELRKAAAALEKSVALSNAGDTHHRLGQIYSELHDWSKAREALTRALGRGGLKNPGGAWLLLGLAQYKLDARDQARDAFTKAANTPAVRKSAEQWLEHIDRKGKQTP